MNPAADQPTNGADWAGPELGEDWKSDLLIWGLPVFGEPTDGLLREVFGLAGYGALDDQSWLPLLVALVPAHDRRRGTDAQRAELANQLSGHLGALRSAANPPEPRRPRWRRPLSRQQEPVGPAYL